MIHPIKTTSFFILAALMFANMWFFYKGIGLSDKIGRYERELTRLEKSNIDLEVKLRALEGIDKTASLAGQLGFGTFNQPLHADKPQFAYQR